jgi:hypothetical protein
MGCVSPSSFTVLPDPCGRRILQEFHPRNPYFAMSPDGLPEINWMAGADIWQANLFKQRHLTNLKPMDAQAIVVLESRLWAVDLVSWGAS